MNTRQMFDALFDFRTDTCVPEWEFGYWYDTIARWYGEGLPRVRPARFGGEVQFIGGDVCAWPDPMDGSVTPSADVHDFFQLDEPILSVPLNMNPLPAYERVTHAQDAETLTYTRGDGKTVRTRRDGTSMPQFLRYPVSTRADFAAMKPRFAAELAPRMNAPLERLKPRYAARTAPLQLGGSNFCGFYSVLRELMGVEETAYLLHDDPAFADEILDFFTDYYISLYTQLLRHISVDCLLIWEDMCFKNGPLISPAMFRRFCAPRYKRLIDAMKALGISKFIVDTDGNCERLIDEFLEVGVNALYPFEAAAGMDVLEIRRRHPSLVIIGGIDKRMLAAGKREIDAQVRIAERMLERGGYLPCVDHAVTPDVSFENYRYFRGRMRAVLRP